MATTTTKKRPAAGKAATPHRHKAKAPEPTAVDYLERAVDDLGKARELAQRDVRAHIDSAIDRVREISKDLAEEIRKCAPGHAG